MTMRQQARFWLITILVTAVLVYLLRNILLPFVVGMAVAYFMDPIVDKLEEMGLSRWLGTSLVTCIFVLFILVAVLLIVPLLIDQAASFFERIPEYFQRARDLLGPYLERFGDAAPGMSPEEFRQTIGNSIDKIMQATGAIASGLWGGGLALANLISLVLITPVVAFFLLRDWDDIVARIDGWLPRPHAAIIRDLARQVDRVLAGFVRGQATVCLILAIYYGVALLLMGLDFGLIIGIVSGLISFVPFVGAITGFIVSVGVATLQFWPDLVWIAAVGAVFMIGQALEGNFLTPKLVGDRVGLHPVWVLFGLLAGGALFGFVGVLLAVPVAAVVGVISRFGISQYLASGYYSGTAGAPGPTLPENGRDGGRDE